MDEVLCEDAEETNVDERFGINKATGGCEFRVNGEGLVNHFFCNGFVCRNKKKMFVRTTALGRAFPRALRGDPELGRILHSVLEDKRHAWLKNLPERAYRGVRKKDRVVVAATPNRDVLSRRNRFVGKPSKQRQSRRRQSRRRQSRRRSRRRQRRRSRRRSRSRRQSRRRR